MITTISIALALLALICVTAILLLSQKKKHLEQYERLFLQAYIAKVDTLPAIIEALENAGVSHGDLSEVRKFHRNSIIFSRSSSYLILNQNTDTTRILKTLMRISLPYRELQQSGAFIHAREIFTSQEGKISQLKEQINQAISRYEFARRIYLLTPIGWIHQPEERHFITR